MKFHLLVAMMATMLLGCTIQDGDLVATADANHPQFQDGNADNAGDPSSDTNPPETGIDSENDGSTDDSVSVGTPVYAGLVLQDCPYAVPGTACVVRDTDRADGKLECIGLPPAVESALYTLDPSLATIESLEEYGCTTTKP